MEERSKCPGNKETEGIEITGIKGEWTSGKDIKEECGKDPNNQWVDVQDPDNQRVKGQGHTES